MFNFVLQNKKEVVNLTACLFSLKTMENSKIEWLVKELNELSEFEEQNKKRMLEIAHVLVMYYNGKKS